MGLLSGCVRFMFFCGAVLVIAWGIEAASYRNPKTGSSSGQKGPAEIRLGFFNADWSTVLNRVCKESGSTLVMNEVPPGRFSRYDRNRYNRTEAVRILNRELEPKGFRLVEKGRFLDVIYLRSARAEYHRPELPRQPQQPKALPVAHQKNPVTKQRMPRVQNISTRSGNPSAATQAANTQPLNGRTAEPHKLPAERLRELLNASRSAQPKPIEKEILRVVRPRQRRAVDLARTIYKSLKHRAELVNRGPAGLPAFRAFYERKIEHPAVKKSAQGLEGQKTVQFTMGIDTARNELVIQAPPTLNRNLGELVRQLDLTTLRAGEKIQLVSTVSDPTNIKIALQPQLQLLAQVSPTKQPDGSGKKIEKVIPRQGGLPAVIPIIRGRVTIRDVPGVGLVVTGNEKDVAAVLQIIRQLDEQGRVTTPNINLHLLKHVNSLALSELLTAVYQQLTNIRLGGVQQNVGSVAFIPVIRPNAVLILASKLDLESILKLIDELDKPVDPQKEFRVFRLKFAVASQVVANMDALFQQQQQAAGGNNQNNQRGLSMRVRAIADVRTNSVIVEAPPNDMAAVANLIQKFDQERINSVSRVKIIPLKNAVADELATLINTAIQSVINPPSTAGLQGGNLGAGGQSSQQLRDAKSAVLEFLSPDGDNKRLLRSGILADIRVTANARTNSLIVTAPETSMALMEALIHQLDLPSKMVAEIKVFTLANGDASAMVTLLDGLFSTSTQQGQTNVQLALADDASSGLIPLRFSVDPRTNSIIAIGGTAALTVVEAVILRLDESDARQRQTSVVRLKNAPASDISTAINNFLQSQRDLANIDPNLVSNQELLEKEIIVVPEPISNSLLLSTTPRYEKVITDLINELDAAPPQVIIQALLVEVELDNTDEFGIELGFQDSMFFDRGVISNLQTINETVTQPNGNSVTNQTIISQERTPGFNFNNQPLGNNSAANPSSVASQALSNFSLGRVNGDLGYGGLVLSASSSSISVLLRALAAKRTVHVLSRPQITTLDNQLAQIQVGQDVPIVQGVTTTATGSANPNVNQRNVGIILTVTPRINPDGTIVMEVVAEKSALAGQGVPIFTDANTGNVIESPIINITTARSTLSVPNGQTVVMGGMITKSDDTIQRKVPWLGDIPYLGYAFRYDSTNTRRSELLIFLTPRVVKNDGDAELIKQIESERLHFIERDAERLHGPLFAVPAAEQGQMPKPITPQKTGNRLHLPDFDDGTIPSTQVPASGSDRPSGLIPPNQSSRFKSRSNQPVFSQSKIQQTSQSVPQKPATKKKPKSRFTFFNPFKSKSR
ncbi:MAG: hypothetical protein Tsb009_29900 [Planctomycetaceae bacterium]